MALYIPPSVKVALFLVFVASYVECGIPFVLTKPRESQFNLSTIIESGTENDEWESKCRKPMEEYGLTNRFPVAVSHIIHSITLQDIQRYFENNASPEIRIPSVNPDHTSQHSILFDVVDSPRDTNFHTLAMQLADQVLTNGRYDDDLCVALFHTLHMHEEWEKTSLAYKELKKSNSVPKEVCSCVLDIESNEVLQMLRHVALKIREPELMGATVEKLRAGFAEYVGATMHFTENMDGITPISLIKSSAEWDVEKIRLQNRDNTNDYHEVATFLFCILN